MIVLLIISILLNIFFVIQNVLISRKYDECNEKFKAELEDIKAEIEELKPNNPNFKYYGVETRTINNVLDILNKRIAELKGENK